MYLVFGQSFCIKVSVEGLYHKLKIAVKVERARIQVCSKPINQLGGVQAR
jgi:hypothetical protein